MNKGKIVEQGNHDELLKNFPQGIYTKFVNEKQKSENDPAEDQAPVLRRRVSKDGQAKPVNKELEKLEEQMKQKVDAIDEVKDKELAKIKE